MSEAAFRVKEFWLCHRSSGFGNTRQTGTWGFLVYMWCSFPFLRHFGMFLLDALSG